MQSMVPSCRRGEGRNPLGPTTRAVDPYTNARMSTLYEVIQAKDILRGNGGVAHGCRDVGTDDLSVWESVTICMSIAADVRMMVLVSV
jgi:hypothetical protein